MSIWNLESGIFSERPFSIYLHIPFCRRLCPYCHFYRIPEVPHWETYRDALAREIQALDLPQGAPVGTLYAGGGTPTLLPPEFYRSLMAVLGERFDLSALAEATIESDGNEAPGMLETFAGAGFDRISIGVKSFDPAVRDRLGAGILSRPDPVSTARTAGFSSVGLDLLYGVEGQSRKSLVSDLARAAGLAPDHLSLYALEASEAGGPREADTDTAAAMFRESARVLGALGYGQYEITNFARPGHRSLHNTVYWEDGDFIGLGPSAHSSLTAEGVRSRWRNRPDLREYLEDPLQCREELSREKDEERAREAIILGLRMTRGVHRPSFARRYGMDPVELLGPHLEELTALGLLRRSAVRLRLTVRGMLLSNEVFVRVLEDG